MHVKAKQVAFLGLLAAVDIICMILASVIRTNTLFLLAAAAFFVGISIREFGIRIGFGFFLTCVILGLFLSPNKIYVLTYTGLSLYILWNELVYIFLARAFFQKYRAFLSYILKIIFFNVLYVPAILLFPKFIYQGTISTVILIGLLVAGEVAWFIYDKAYEYFQAKVWTKIRHKINFFK